MPKEIELPDGSIAEFPDDMPDDAISTVLRQQFPSDSDPTEPPATPGPSMPRQQPPRPPTSIGGEESARQSPLQKLLSSGLMGPSDLEDPVGRDVSNILKGAVKGVGQLAFGAGEAIREGGRRVGLVEDEEPLTDRISGARRKRSLGERIRGTQEALGLKPEGTAQSIGAFAGKAVPAFATGGTSLVPQLAASAALSGGQTALEGGEGRDIALSTVLGAGGPVAGKVLGRLAPKLSAAAVEQYKRALHATTRKGKIATGAAGQGLKGKDIVPELLRRRVSGSLEDLAAKGEQLSGEAGEAIEGAYKTAAGAGKKVDTDKLIQELDTLKASFTAPAKDQAAAFRLAGDDPQKLMLAQQGRVVVDDAAFEKMSQLQAKLDSLSPDPHTIWQFRKSLDDVVRSSGGFEKAVSPKVAAGIAKNARAVIQKELMKANPDLARLNAEYGLWEDLQQIASETALRQTGQQGSRGWLARAAGGVVGAILGTGGGPVTQAAAAAGTSSVMGRLANMVSSPRWRTVSAVQKAKIADLMSSGKTQELADYLGRIAGTTAGRVSMDIRTGVENKRRSRDLSQKL